MQCSFTAQAAFELDSKAFRTDGRNNEYASKYHMQITCMCWALSFIIARRPAHAAQMTDELSSKALALAVGVLPSVWPGCAAAVFHYCMQTCSCNDLLMQCPAVQVTDELSSKAFRLMALAVGVLPKVSQLDVQRLSQQQLEKRAHKLELLGLVVLTNPIKPDSRNTVTELQDK